MTWSSPANDCEGNPENFLRTAKRRNAVPFDRGGSSVLYVGLAVRRFAQSYYGAAFQIGHAICGSKRRALHSTESDYLAGPAPGIRFTAGPQPVLGSWPCGISTGFGMATALLPVVGAAGAAVCSFARIRLGLVAPCAPGWRVCGRIPGWP